MWENQTEQETMQPSLYPPGVLREEVPLGAPLKASAVKEKEPERKAEKEKEPESSSSPCKANRRPGPAAGGRREPDTNYLLLAQLMVCLAVVGFVLLIRSTNAEFYEELGQAYQSALQDGTELSGQDQLLKFTEEAVAQLREAAQQALDKVEDQSQAAAAGAGGWNPVSTQDSLPPSGYSLSAYTLKEAPQLPLEQFSVSSDYGFREHPITGEADFHGGLDLAAAQGTPVHAVLAGIVLQTGTSDSYGNYVRILHDGQLVTTYNHMDSYCVQPGDMLQKGQTLGYVGSTGIATGPHLHVEFLLGGVRVNPAPAFDLP